ncbi:MAG: glycosyltransferase [Bacillota bacterium]
MYAAIAIAERWPARAPARRASCLPDGISVIIPERDAPDLLERALDSLAPALARLNVPAQVIVVVNGAPPERYAALASRFREIEWVHRAEALGFSAATLEGLQRARYAWSFLMNNDMTLAEDALVELHGHCDETVFAAGCQIEQRSASGRREETGFTDWHRDERGVHLFHADPLDRTEACEHLCASGGASLFRTDVLCEYARDTLAFDPFYWEDVDWSLRAWRDGWRVLFCPRARAWHRHRATVSRFYSPQAIERISTRNALLVESRHVAGDASSLMQRICDQPYETQRELSALCTAVDVFRLRRGAGRSMKPTRPIEMRRRGGVAVEAPDGSYCFRLADGSSARARLLLVTPYGVFPPRHGGGRRVAELVRLLKTRYDVVLLSDEAARYDSRAFVDFDGLRAVRLVQRPDDAAASRESSLEARMRSHCHARLREALEEAITQFEPQLVQIEHAELAPLVAHRRAAQRWILSLHDAYGPGDFSDAAAGRAFEDMLQRYDGIVAVSPEDAAMVSHARVTCVPNGARRSPRHAYRPSSSRQLLFMGPFRYARNVEGIRLFLREAFPAIRRAAPGTRLVVLGGDEAAQVANGETIFRQEGVEVLAHREDVPELLAAAALTVNPLRGIRGSAIKLIESLMAGRVCVTTREGARGFEDRALPGLVAVEDVSAMVEPIVSLLRDDEERHRREAPADEALAAFTWERCAAQQHALYASFLAGES